MDSIFFRIISNIIVCAWWNWNIYVTLSLSFSFSLSTSLYFQVPWGYPYRAHLTLPPEVELTKSSIPEARLGIIARTFLRKYTWLAEYEGEIVVDEQEISDYAWGVSFRTFCCTYFI